MISCAVIKKESLARAIVRLVRDSVFFSCKISGSSQRIERKYDVIRDKVAKKKL